MLLAVPRENSCTSLLAVGVEHKNPQRNTSTAPSSSSLQGAAEALGAAGTAQPAHTGTAVPPAARAPLSSTSGCSAEMQNVSIWVIVKLANCTAPGHCRDFHTNRDESSIPQFWIGQNLVLAWAASEPIPLHSRPKIPYPHKGSTHLYALRLFSAELNWCWSKK